MFKQPDSGSILTQFKSLLFYLITFLGNFLYFLCLNILIHKMGKYIYTHLKELILGIRRVSACKSIIYCMCVCAKSLQSCLTLCDPMKRSLSGSSVHGILQARILSWQVLYHSCLLRSPFYTLWNITNISYHYYQLLISSFYVPLTK